MSDKKNDEERLEASYSQESIESKKPLSPEAKQRVLAALRRILERRAERARNQRRVQNAELRMTPVASDWIM